MEKTYGCCSIDTRLERKHIDTIRHRYSLGNCSEQDICAFIDQAHFCVYHGFIPDNKIVASMIYDLAATLSFQENKISEQEYIQSVSEKEKTYRITSYSIEHNMDLIRVEDLTLDLDIADYLDVESLSKLTREQRVNNPHILINNIYAHGVDAVKYIPDVKLLCEWCQSDKNYYPADVTQEVEQILAKEFGKIERQIFIEGKTQVENKNESIGNSDLIYLEGYYFEHEQGREI